MDIRWNSHKFHYLVLAISLAGCAMLGGSEVLQSTQKPSLQWINSTGSTDAENGVAKLQFIVVASLFLGLPKSGVLVLPYYSIPGILPVTRLRSLSLDTETNVRHLPPLGDVKALLVCHAHYDHALDIP